LTKPTGRPNGRPPKDKTLTRRVATVWLTEEQWSCVTEGGMTPATRGIRRVLDSALGIPPPAPAVPRERYSYTGRPRRERIPGLTHKLQSVLRMTREQWRWVISNGVNAKGEELFRPQTVGIRAAIDIAMKACPRLEKPADPPMYDPGMPFD
jgi:hypothetical protein